ncbi:MAG: hypothetical protein JWL73_2223 [Actinomycetia bacterium]|nr:hypothetical protein [Actinomycetes bacterium]
MTDTPRAVALFASAFHPHVGGVEELVRQLAHQQQEQGGTPLVVTMRWPKDLAAVETFEGIPVRRHVFRLPERKPRFLAAYAVEQRRIQRAVNRDLVEHGAEVVHVQCVSGNGWYAYRAARELGLPLVVTLQGELTMDAGRVYETSTVLPKLLRRLLLEADAVTACSRHTLEEAEAFTGVELGRRGSVIPNGVNLAEIRDAVPAVRERPYVLAIGRHVRQKGFDVLIDAWPDVLAAVPDLVDLVIAGDGPEHGGLLAQAWSVGLGDSIVFPGRCDRATAVSLFAGCSAFVLPSRHEPFGIVNLEAMAAGKPVVATDVGGVPDVVDSGVTGLLVPPEDPGAVAAAVTQVLTKPDLADALGAAGKARSDAFSWSKVADRYATLYEHITEHPSGRRETRKP